MLKLESVRYHSNLLKHRIETLLISLDCAIEEEDEETKSLGMEDINKNFRLVEIQYDRLKRFISK